MLRLVVLLFVLMVPFVAHAATCDAGKYLENGACVGCGIDGYYCPGDDTRHACPDAPLVFNFDASFGGYAVNVIKNSWGCSTPSNVTCCGVYGDWVSERAGGYFSSSYNQSSNRYETNVYLYYTAFTGWYLTNVTSWSPSYHDSIAACTNKPTNSHYTGPGTPDSADGTIVDANDCPWVCDAGYYLNNGQCVVCTNWERDPYYCPGDNNRYACPAVTGELADRVDYYEHYPDDHDSPDGCYVYLTEDDDTADYVNICYYDVENQEYGGTNATCQVWGMKCAAGYRSIFAESQYYQSWGGASSVGLGPDFLKGNVCVPCATGTYSTYNANTCSSCTNTKPANSHYSGSATSNDCPWECDSGYALTSSNTCEQLCTAGVTGLHTSTGLVFNLYANKQTSPAIHIMPDGTNTVCYTSLAPGAANNAVNVEFNGAIYHSID